MLIIIARAADYFPYSLIFVNMFVCVCTVMCAHWVVFFRFPNGDFV